MKKTLLATILGLSTLAVVVCFTSAKKASPIGTYLKEVLDGISEKMKSGMKRSPKGMDGDGKAPPAPPAGATASGAKAGMGDSPFYLYFTRRCIFVPFYIIF